MRIAYCDCFSGISGDMFLAALLDAGMPLTELQQGIAMLHLPEKVELTLKETHKGPLRASQLQVQVGPGEHHRHPTDIRELIEGSDLSARVKHDSQKVFDLLAQAEARVHGVPADEIHFHEVGATDSIVDIVGAALGLEYLGIDRLYASPLPYGSGQVKTQHGVLPLPAPATLEIARLVHIPLLPMDASHELVTPTGAAILGALATFEQPSLIVTGLGVGAGKRDLAWPNVLRLMVGEVAAGDGSPHILIETNIDDMNPQLYGYVMNRLFEAGALDVYMTPVYMKKNRPGTVLAVIARQSDEQRLARLILEETTTLGLRVQPMRRYEAERRMTTVSTAYGDVPLKLKILGGAIVQAVPEYDACVRLAGERQVALSAVYGAAMLAAGELLRSAQHTRHM